MTQDEAIKILKTGANVFLTGEPGAGKTYTINQYVAYLRDRGVEVAITASTGIAATHIGGMTIHSWSGIGIKTGLDKRDVRRIVDSSYSGGRMRRAQVLIIDEVSMLSPDTLDTVDTVCRAARKNSQAFGGLQVVLVGDFFQLPPVVRREREISSQDELFAPSAPLRFAYQASSWGDSNLTVCYLTEQYRQDDSIFLNILSAIRRNEFDEDHAVHIASRKIEKDATPEGIPKLFSHNADVDRVNEVMLEKLPGYEKAFTMSCSGPERFTEALSKSCLSPQILRLKPGAAVMFTKNNSKDGFVNGTLGTVEGFAPETGLPLVRTTGGKLISVSPMDWSVEEGGNIKASITQFPLRLAWAITVHKSQGMSMDAAVMDLSQVFEHGQGYVALSRVRRLSGLHLLGFNNNAFRVDPDVLEQDTIFRRQSQGVSASLQKVSPEALVDKYRDFIVRAGGRVETDEVVSKKKRDPVVVSTSSGFSEIRKTHPKAYSRWSPEEDADLRKEFGFGHSVATLAGVFSRKKGAIISRLKKLGLLEE